MNARIIEFSPIEDARGSMIAIEGMDTLPFEIKRVYYIYNTLANVRRGSHAHRTLHQVLVAVSGSCKILVDDGNSRTVFPLQSPHFGLYLGPGNWREMYDFSPDCVLLVLASEHYFESDYIRNYEEFLSCLDGREPACVKPH